MDVAQPFAAPKLVGDDCDSMLCKKATPQESFVLMLQDRLVQAEERIAGMQRALDDRAPARPQSSMSISRLRKGWFFTFKAHKELWPAIDDTDSMQTKASLLVDALEGLAPGADATLVLAPETLGRSKAGSVINAILHHEGYQGTEEAEEASVDVIFAKQYIVVEGVITSTSSTCTSDVVGAAIERAWQSSWTTLDDWKQMVRPEWHTLPKNLMRILCLNTPGVFELSHPRACESIMQAGGSAFYMSCGKLAVKGEVVSRVEEHDDMYDMYREAIFHNNTFQPNNARVAELIKELCM